MRTPSRGNGHVAHWPEDRDYVLVFAITIDFSLSLFFTLALYLDISLSFYMTIRFSFTLSVCDSQFPSMTTGLRPQRPRIIVIIVVRTTPDDDYTSLRYIVVIIFTCTYVVFRENKRAVDIKGWLGIDRLGEMKTIVAMD